MPEKPAEPLAGLFERLARGDSAALEEVCRRYGSKVADIARRHLGPALHKRLETADVAQEALMEIVRASSGVRFKTEEAFLCWAHGIVEHSVARAARYWRAARRKAEREVSLGTGKGDVDPRSERPSQVLARKEQTARISQAISSLPKSYRDVVISRLLLSLPWAAVARSLGTTESAAQMRLTRARRRLAALLRSSKRKP